MVEIREFLAQHHLGVVGLRPADDEVDAQLWERLVGAGYQVELVAPSATDLGVVHPSVAALPDGVGGLLVLHAGVASAAVTDCAARAIPRVWIHRRLLVTSEGHDAVVAGRAAGLVVIDGTCPLLFLDRYPVARQGGRAHRPVERWLRR